MASVLSGKTIPLSVTLKQLDGSWHCITPEHTADAAETLVRMIAMGEAHQAWAPEVMYTHGETVVIAGETYLFAYARPSKPLLLPGRGNREEAQPVLLSLTPDTEVFLTLLNIRSMGNLLDIHPFDLKRELARDSKLPSGPVGMKAEQTQSINNLRQLAVATMIYVQDNNEVMPPMDTIAHWIDALKMDMRVTVQPGTKEPYQPNITLSKKKLGDLAKPAEIVLCYEQHPWPDGMRGVAFCDGHVTLVNAQTWQQLQATMKPGH